MIIPFEYLAIAAAVFIVIIVIACLMYIKDLPRLRKVSSERQMKERSTFFMNAGKMDDCCEICFGDLDRRLFVAECGCRRIFHEDCVRLTDECPYCHGHVEDMRIRRVRRMRCPRCGREMTSNICRCGVVIPRADGTFECSCGNRMHMNDDSCPVCGTRYVPTQTKINRGRDDRSWSSKP